MKKILALLGACCLTATGASSVIACNDINGRDDLNKLSQSKFDGKTIDLNQLTARSANAVLIYLNHMVNTMNGYSHVTTKTVNYHLYSTSGYAPQEKLADKDIIKNNYVYFQLTAVKGTSDVTGQTQPLKIQMVEQVVKVKTAVLQIASNPSVISLLLDQKIANVAKNEFSVFNAQTQEDYNIASAILSPSKDGVVLTLYGKIETTGMQLIYKDQKIDITAA